VERVRVVSRHLRQLVGAAAAAVGVVVALPVLRTGRVEVDGAQEQRNGTLAARRQAALSARRLAAAVADERLPVVAQRDAGTHLAVAVVSEQHGARLLGARVVRRQVGRVPARLGGHRQPEVGQGTELGVVEVVEKADDGRLEHGQLQRPARLVDVRPVGRRVLAGFGRPESQPDRAVAR